MLFAKNKYQPNRVVRAHIIVLMNMHLNVCKAEVINLA